MAKEDLTADFKASRKFNEWFASPYKCCERMAQIMIDELFTDSGDNARNILREVIAQDLFDSYKQKMEKVRRAGVVAEKKKENFEKLFGKNKKLSI